MVSSSVDDMYDSVSWSLRFWEMAKCSGNIHGLGQFTTIASRIQSNIVKIERVQLHASASLCSASASRAMQLTRQTCVHGLPLDPLRRSGDASPPPGRMPLVTIP
jgi:hypothetical protein